MIGSGCWRWLALMASVVAFSVQAEQRVDLYQVQELVASQSGEARKAAAADALARVLVRVTGDRKIADLPELSGHLSQAQNYVLQFGYGRSDQTLTDEQGVESPAFALTFRFSEPAVEKLLKRLQLPNWPASRPSLLVWLIEDQWPNGRALVKAPEPEQSIRQEAMRRGLPIQFPLWDLQDQMMVNIDQLWSFDETSIREASARYQPEVIVVGRFSRTSSGEIRGVWQWLDGESQNMVDAQAQTLGAWSAPMIDQLADLLASRYAIVPGQDLTGQLVLTVNDVDGFARYREVLTYLENHEALRDVRVARAEGTTLVLYLSPEADLAHLQRALQLDRKLIPMQTLQAPDGSETNPLMYRWYR